MDRELARQLKEAGLDTDGDEPAYQYFTLDGERYRAPTLEELLEACGAYVYLLPLDDGGVWESLPVLLIDDCVLIPKPLVTPPKKP
jgi:hypothetical protein